MFNLLEHHLTFLLNNGTKVVETTRFTFGLTNRNCIENDEDETDSIFANQRVTVLFKESVYLRLSITLVCFSHLGKILNKRRIKLIICRVDDILRRLLQLSHS